ncbi:uncharacterized protein G2W53_017763 [Senna tora]|uniref:Uncharacterized protein n=1 Tax=Senna tora TaxID=362788 RepID=A0A834TRT8_9FABA|nr:uncharacterized protein G2W53_017763 [Senna tora]
MVTERSLSVVVSLQQILPEKMQKCFGRVKKKKPPPPRKRKYLVWRQVREISCSTLFRIFHRFSNDDFVKTTVVEWERIGISKDDINIVVFCNYMIFLSTHLLFLLSVLCFVQL